MPALNNMRLVERPTTVYFSNDADENNAVVASIVPVQNASSNLSAQYYAYASRTDAFAIYVPYGYALNSVFTYNDVNDEWQLMPWQEVAQGTPYDSQTCYYKTTTSSNSILSGYTAYVFSDHDGDGDPVHISPILSFNVV